MATIKKAVPKAQKGKKVSVMRAYVDKYKNSGGLSGNVANDTLGGNSPRFNNYDGGFGGGRMNQIKDLQAAHDKKFGKNSTVDERKNGGTIKKAQAGRKLKLSEKYAKTADSLSNEDLRKMTAAGKMNVNRKEPRWKQKTDSLIKSADKDFKGSLEARKKAYELRKKGMKTGGAVKKKMKNGGSLSGLTASNRRDKGIDPKGAYTTVQKKTLAGAKGKAKLTADKQLGATKMTAKRGMSISKKK